MHICTKLAYKNYSIAPVDSDFNEVKIVAINMASKMLNLSIAKFFSRYYLFFIRRVRKS